MALRPVRRPEIDRVLFIVLREMRRPLLVLIGTYAVAILGMALVPGRDGEPMSLFHAFYFVMYTATTTGFGEIPEPFSDAQRLWASFCLFATVVAWLYSIGAIIRLLQNPYFQLTVSEWRLSRAVRRLPESFYILCGFGDTGSLLARGFSDYGISAVVLDKDENRIRALRLRDYTVPMPGLVADAGMPRYLVDAGVDSERCRGVIALTSDEETNLKIAAIARLINPEAQVIAKSASQVHEETLMTLGPKTAFVDPFKVFAKLLGAAICEPKLYILNEWLTWSRGVKLTSEIKPPPRGHWIISGYGRMGREVYKTLKQYRLSVAVIDPEPPVGDDVEIYIRGRTTARTLRAAGIEKAVGIIAATDDDGHNLSILLAARQLRPGIYTVVRQNRHQNEIAFQAAEVDMIMQPSLITARQILLMVVAPRLRSLYVYLVRECRQGRREVLDRLVERLQERIGERQPWLKSYRISPAETPTLIQALQAGAPVYLEDLLRSPSDRKEPLSLIPLVLLRQGQELLLPPEEIPLQEGDEILFCGSRSGLLQLEAIFHNEYLLHYLLTGKERPHGYLAQWFCRWLGEGVGSWPRRRELRRGPGW